MALEKQKTAGLLTSLCLGIVKFFYVPEGYVRVVTKWGKYVRHAEPGLRKCLYLWGLYEQPGQLVPYMEQIREYAEEMVFTKDGVKCLVDVVVFFKVNDVYRALYSIEDYETAIRNLVQSVLRNECGDLALYELLNSRKKIAERMRECLDADASPWGISIRLVEIKEIKIDYTHDKEVQHA